MSWNDVDDKHKRKYDGNFVSCTEKYEVDYLVELIIERYNLSETTVRNAINECCNSVSGNRPRKEFMDCLKKRLRIN